MFLEEAPPAGDANELLRATYGSILTTAREHGARSIAMPAIGAGVLGFAAGRTAKVAFEALREHAAVSGSLERVDFAFVDDSAFLAWKKAAHALLGARALVGEAGRGGIEVFDI